MKAYTRGVVSADSTVTGGGGAVRPQPMRRRRPPSAAEQARRKAWGAVWRNVGIDWKRKRQAEGK